MKEKLNLLLKKQSYGLVGSHSSVKLCTWLKKSIRDTDVCYKEQFYGIRSHLCCQCSVSVGFCQNMCVFCWREMEHTVGTEMKEYDADVKKMVDDMILAQIKLMSGFGGFEGANKKKLKEAQEPMHFAISLTGDALIYPKLNEFIQELHKRGKTTFVVTNGMLPEKLAKIEPPTQLYLSVDAPNEELFKKIDRPILKDGWERLLSSLKALKKLKTKTRTAIRITAIKGMNMTDEKGYAELIKMADPHFVEVKAYMHVGSSRERLLMENMPRHPEVREFAEKIGELIGYKIVDEKKESRVLLLMKEDTKDRIMKF